MNVVFLDGNLTADPELRFSQSGTAICNMRMANNEYYKDSGGERQERTTFVRLVAFGKLAENCNEFLSKGSRIENLTGRLQIRQYEDRDGAQRWSTEIVLNNIRFGRKPQSQQQKTASQGDTQDVPAATADDVAF